MDAKLLTPPPQKKTQKTIISFDKNDFKMFANKSISNNCREHLHNVKQFSDDTRIECTMAATFV